MTTLAPMSDAALEQLRELAKRRRDELTVVRVQRDTVAARIAERELAQVDDLATLRQLDDRAGFLTGWLEARRLP